MDNDAKIYLKYFNNELVGFLFKFGIVILLMLMSRHVHADDISNICSDYSGKGGTLNNLIDKLSDDTEKWGKVTGEYAKNIFVALFTFEFLWQLIVKKIFADDLEKIWIFIVIRMIAFFFLKKYAIVTGTYIDFINFFARLGFSLHDSVGDYSHWSFAQSGGHFTKGIIGPSAVMHNFTCVSQMINKVTDGSTGDASFITTKITMALFQVIIFVLLALIAFTIIKAFIQTYFIVYIGIIMAGFAGSSWTFSFWQKYAKAVVGVAVKFLIIAIIMGMVLDQENKWIEAIKLAYDPTKHPEDYDLFSTIVGITLQIAGSAVIFALLAYQLPEWMASTLAGDLSFKFDDKMGGAVARFISGGMDVTNHIANHASHTGSNSTKLEHNVTEENGSMSAHHSSSGSAQNIVRTEVGGGDSSATNFGGDVIQNASKRYDNQ